MNFKKICRALLFPHIAIATALLPISAILLLYSFLNFESASVTSIISYVISAYTLTLWCVRLPQTVRFFGKLKKENKYLIRWKADARLRVNVSLYKTLLWNTAYAALNAGMGIYHRSFWFGSLAIYYILLAVMRFYLLLYSKRHKICENMIIELKKYRACGIILLIMNLALALMIFFMIYWNRTFYHHEITTITLAAYTFISLTLAIVDSVKYRKYNSPIYSATKVISLVAACVSMLTLESTMLTTFGSADDLIMNRILLGVSGAVISAVILWLAIRMIVFGAKELNLLKNNANN